MQLEYTSVRFENAEENMCELSRSERRLSFSHGKSLRLGRPVSDGSVSQGMHTRSEVWLLYPENRSSSTRKATELNLGRLKYEVQN